MPTVIRNASAEDAQDICRVVRESICVCCTADHHHEPQTIANWLQNKTPENICQWIAAPGAIALLAEQAGRSVGFALVRAGELSLCYVAPEVLHQGVGKALLNTAMQRASTQGIAALHLNSTRTALSFYLRNGFAVTGPAQNWTGLEAQPMHKALV